MKYSFKKGLGKVIKYFILFVIPFAVNAFIVEFPDIAQLSVGAVLVGIANFLKVKNVVLFKSI